ncbi:MAG: hypothetical protein H6660_05790 [Ardenticatenaceae bacterium]|nr:hypothetical protein [Ardenticatenaceae bacterium]
MARNRTDNARTGTRKLCRDERQRPFPIHSPKDAYFLVEETAVSHLA